MLQVSGEGDATRRCVRRAFCMCVNTRGTDACARAHGALSLLSAVRRRGMHAHVAGMRCVRRVPLSACRACAAPAMTAQVWDIKDAGLQAASRVSAASNPLRLLSEISQNFPSLVSSLTNQKASGLVLPDCLPACQPAGSEEGSSRAAGLSRCVH